MELLIFFSASCFFGFLIMSLFINRINQSIPHNRVLRSLGRLAVPAEKNITSEYSRREKLQNFSRNILHIYIKPKNNNRQSNKDMSLSAAGLKNWSYTEWRILKYVSGFFALLTTGLICYLFVLPSFLSFEITIVGSIIGLVLPDYWLKRRKAQRKDDIERTLPDVLDLIMVSVEAGLGFDAALLKVVEKQNGVLAQEFNLVLQEIKMGRPRREALKDMSKKNDVEDLSNIIAALIQADQLGISIGSVLRNQSSQIRLKRRQRAQEQAHKAPVKIMIPLVFFIFPSIFIVILGPAVIHVIEIFGE